MKLVVALLIFCRLGLFASAADADAPIEFRGVMAGTGATKLSLKDRTTDTTRWVEVGQTFAGYTVTAYDAAKETASLNKDGAELRLRMNAAQVAEESPPPTLSPDKIEAIRNNLRQIAAAADQYRMETGKSSVSVAELVGPEKYIKQLNPVAGENYAGLQLTGSEAAALRVTTSTGVVVDYDLPVAQRWATEIQPPPPGTYPIVPGDTGAKIAARHNLSLRDLQAMNPGVDWSKLHVGQTVKVK
ncbi:MAG TPA: LysM domain-containing protein [Opitutaceae bacterium]|nr:LysM domain-containing protein [Opitutaceae bacterium]